MILEENNGCKLSVIHIIANIKQAAALWQQNATLSFQSINISSIRINERRE